MAEKDIAVKKSAELLRQGATMLSLTCPKCNSPLFRLKNGDIVCPIHGKVIVVSSESEVVEKSSIDLLLSIEKNALRELERLNALLVNELNIDDSIRYAQALIFWLTVVEKARALKKTEK